jgi:hypothetical protein
MIHALVVDLLCMYVQVRGRRPCRLTPRGHWWVMMSTAGDLKVGMQGVTQYSAAHRYWGHVPTSALVNEPSYVCVWALDG